MVKVLSDSTCDLSQELLDKYDISIIPLHIVKGEEELEDGTDIEKEDVTDIVVDTSDFLKDIKAS